MSIDADEIPMHLRGSGDRAAWLAAGYCPDSGERLSVVTDWWQRRRLMCPDCDCFGYPVREAPLT